MEINKPSDFGRALKSGPYSWPGGYPLLFVCSDSEALCFGCARRNGKTITESIRDSSRSGWAVIAVATNYEDPSCYCGHCGERIPSAYAENEEISE